MDAHDDEGALLAAIARKDLEAVRRLARPHLLNGRRDGGEVVTESLPLAAALEHGAFEIAEVLLAQGASLTARNRDGETPLQEVLWHEHPRAAVEWLLARGASPNDAVIDTVDGAPGETTLHFAVQVAQPEVVEVLLAAGADVHARTPAGQTALHLAAQEQQGDARVVLALLARGADVTVADQDGLTPLHCAVQHYADFEAEEGAVSSAEELRTVVTALLEKGASVEARAKDGRRPWDLARSRPVPPDVLERLRPRDTSTPLSAFAGPVALAAVGGFLANTGTVLFAVQGGGLTWPTSFPGTPLEGLPELVMLALTWSVVLVAAGAWLDRAVAAPRRAFRVAAAALVALSLGACLLVPAPAGERALLGACFALQGFLTARAVRRTLQPDHGATVVSGGDVGGPKVNVS